MSTIPTTIELIDTLRYRLLEVDKDLDPIARDLDKHLVNLINIYCLDQDQNKMASAPKSLPPSIKKVPPPYTQERRDWINALIDWLPQQHPISIDSFVARCLNNCEDRYSPEMADIKLAVLTLNASGKIVLSNDNMISRVTHEP